MCNFVFSLSLTLATKHFVLFLPRFFLSLVATTISMHAQVILTWTDDATDPQFAISTQALRILEAARDAKGRRLTVHKLHQPDPVVCN